MPATYFIYLTRDWKKTTVKTKTSHGSSSKSIGISLLGKMADQCRLKKEELLDLVDCPLNREAYEKILLRRGVL